MPYMVEDVEENGIEWFKHEDQHVLLDWSRIKKILMEHIEWGFMHINSHLMHQNHLSIIISKGKIYSALLEF